MGDFGFGLGDALTAIQLIYDVYQKCQDAPVQIDAVWADVKLIKVELESMKQKVGDERSFLKKNGGAMLSKITDTFLPLKVDLYDVRRLIREYNAIPPFSGMKIYFSLFKIPELKQIQLKLGGYRAQWSVALEHIGADADTYNTTQLANINKKLAANNSQLARDLAHLKAQQQNGEAKMDKVIKLLQQTPAAAAANAGQLENPQTWNQWQKFFLAQGIKTGDVDKIMESVKGIVQNPQTIGSSSVKQATPPITITSSGSMEIPGNSNLQRSRSQSAIYKPNKEKLPVKVTPRPRSISRSGNASARGLMAPQSNINSEQSPPHDPISSGSPNPLKKVSHSQDPQDSSAGSPSRKPSDAKQERNWILCVDRSNGVRSILAQAYLELVRSWTVNATGRWMFDRVESAATSLKIDDFSSSGPDAGYTSKRYLMKELALSTLAGPESYFWSKSYPGEKDAILSRIKAHKSRAITANDFDRYNYILCFTQQTHDAVEMAKKSAGEQSSKKPMSKVIQLEGCDWYFSNRHTKSVEMEELVENLRASIKRFLKEQFQWSRPPRNVGIAGGPFRTLQMILPQKYKGLIPANGKAIKMSTGCDIRTVPAGYEGKQIVSVTGRKDKLKDAEAAIRAM